MNSLDLAVERVAGWSAARQRDRAAVAELVDGLRKDCERALRVWQGYLDAPGAPGDAFSLITWMGPERVKQLHEIHLDARERAHRICALADPRLARLVLLEDDLIEMAFRGLKAGETGPAAARAAIETLNGRIARLRAQADRLRAAPARPAAKKPAARGAKPAAGRGAKKPAPKRAAKKPRPAARTKSGSGAAAKKKARRK